MFFWGCQEPVLHSTLLQRTSPFLAQSGHLGPRESRLLLGVKRIPRHVCVMSANDPKRTLTFSSPGRQYGSHQRRASPK